MGEPFSCHVYVGAPLVEAAAHVNVTVSPACGVNEPDVKVRDGFSWSKNVLESKLNYYLT